MIDALPSAWLPGPADFIVNAFETEVQFTNHTSKTLYLTAITTTYGEPRVIPQNIAFRQGNIPVKPQGTITLQYNLADLPLAGIVICKKKNDCRLLPANGSGVYNADTYDSLESPDSAWQTVVNAQPEYNFLSLIPVIVSMVCLFLFLSRLYLKRTEN